jgi:predicted Zn-dependent peptidase
MKNILFFSILSTVLLFACTPKTGSKASSTPPASIPGATGSAPAIPIPTGDVRKQAPAPGAAPKIQIGKAETFKLDNGLTVIVVENHKLPKVSYQVFVDNNPVLEKDASGYLQLMGEMLGSGTKIRSKAQINQEIDFIGASFSASPNGVSGSCLKKHSDKFLTILSDVLLNPTFPQEELDKAKVRAESALAQQKDDANAIAENVASVLRYGKDHPYGEIMTEATLVKVTLDQIKGHYKTYFKPNISYLVITGDITKDQAEKYARQFFGRWAKGEVPKHNYGVPRPPEKTQVDFVHKPGAVQSVLNITYPIDLQPGTPDVITARVANTILGGYFNSRVNANLREGHGWTYGARSALNPDELVGSFSGTASVRNAVTDSSIIEFLKEMRRIGTEKVGKEELQVVKNVIAGQFSQRLEEPGTVANFALSTARFGLPADYYERYLEVLQNVTPEEVQAMAKKYINPDHAHIVVVGNREDVAERLKQFSATGRVNFFDAFGNPVNTSNVPLPAGMTAEKVVEDYLNAIGGAAKITAIKDLQTESTMQMRGPSFGIKTWQKGGNKLAVEMSMNTQLMNKQVYADGKGAQIAMGQTAPLEGEQLGDAKEQALFVKEAGYVSGGYKLRIKAIEDVNGANAYVIEVERPDGKKSTEFYDMKTSLKVREMSIGQGADGKPSTQMVEMSDYKPIGGVLFPHQTTVSGVFPVPFKVIIVSAKVNEGIDDAIFNN